MCGIFGVIDTKEKIDLGRVLSARDILTHRGPDYAGIYFLILGFFATILSDVKNIKIYNISNVPGNSVSHRIKFKTCENKIKD